MWGGDLPLSTGQLSVTAVCKGKGQRENLCLRNGQAQKGRMDAMGSVEPT